MPATVREWLPPSLGGGPAEKPRGMQQITVMPSFGTTSSQRQGGRSWREAARERTQGMQNAANAAGMPVSPATDSGFASCCPNLTFQQRVYGCIGCFGVGVFIQMLSFLSWSSGHIPQWAVMYTLGNFVSLLSSGFLFGPKRQCRNMTRARRRVAAGIYLGAMLLTLIGGFMRWPFIILIFLVFVQWCAMIWYIASYIPYGQKMITSCLGRLVDF